MKISIPAASLIALALFTAPLMAQETVAEPPVVQGAEQSAAPVETLIAPEILELLADDRPMSELSGEELVRKAKLANRYSKSEGVPDDMRAQLKEISSAARTEIANREQAAAEKAVEPPKVEEPVVEAPKVEEPPAPVVDAPPVEEPPAPAVEVAAPEVPANVLELLNDARAPSELTNEELVSRAKKAGRFAKSDGLTEGVRAQLQAISEAARNEIAAREEKAAAPAVVEKPAEVVVEPAPLPAVIEVAPTQPLPEAPAVVEVAPPPAPAPAVEAPPADAKQAQTLDGNAGDASAESKAAEFLNDPQAADQLSDDALRTRLDGIRDLMSTNKLSNKTERQLRQKLRAERDVLRDRVAAQEVIAQQKAEAELAAKKPDAAAPEKEKPSTIKKSDYNFNIQIVLNDRRPSDELLDYELRRRLQVYREASLNLQYEDDQRNYWRAVMERDQYLLQQRLLRERRQRQADLQAGYDDEGYDVELDDSQYDDSNEYDDVYAAEVDDEELTKTLTAPPRKKPARRYTVQEVEASPVLRKALPRIEIDTVKFGFNESFVRAEEVANLDRLAEVMERILRKNPREVFLVEGHTDAVGSDAANLSLSRQRSIAIKKALTTYYVIPAKNLQTVGYGERYLKIPTAEAEQENRRVSISRATSLIGEAE